MIYVWANTFENQYNGIYNNASGGEGFCNFLKNYLKAKYIDTNPGHLSNFAGGQTVNEKMKELVDIALSINIIPRYVDRFDSSITKDYNATILNPKTSPESNKDITITFNLENYKPDGTYITSLYYDEPYIFFKSTNSFILGYSDKTKKEELGDSCYSFEDLMSHLSLFREPQKYPSSIEQFGRFTSENKNWPTTLNTQALLECVKEKNNEDMIDVLLACEKIQKIPELSREEHPYPKKNIVDEHISDSGAKSIYINSKFSNYIRTDFNRKNEVFYVDKIQQCVIESVLSDLFDYSGIYCSITIDGNVYDCFTGIPQEKFCDPNSEIHINTIPSNFKLPADSNPSYKQLAYANIETYIYRLFMSTSYDFPREAQRLVAIDLLLRHPEYKDRLFEEKKEIPKSYSLEGVKTDETKANIRKSKNFRNLIESYNIENQTLNYPNTNKLSPKEAHYMKQTTNDGRGV